MRHLLLSTIAVTWAVIAWITPAHGQAIDLSDIVAGGDGSGTASAAYTGIDPSTGAFTGDFYNNYLYPPDGVYAVPTASPFIDSVFIISGAFPLPEGGVQQQVTQSGVTFIFGDLDALGWGFNYILKDRNGGVSDQPIRLSGVDGIVAHAIGIHAAAGITFNLDTLRSAYGAERIACFSTFWGMDACDGDVNLYAFLSNDSGVMLDWSITLRATAETGTFGQLEIPPDAKYLTLATGSNNGGYCDHGTFGMPIITGDSPCFPPSFVQLNSVSPNLVSTLGFTQVTFTGFGFSPGYQFFVGSLPLDFVTVSDDGTTATGFSPEMDAGIYDAIVSTPNGPRAKIPNAFEAAVPSILTSVDPYDVLADGTTALNVHGENFRPDTVIHVGANDLASPVFVDATLITGFAPALGPEEPLGPRNVVAVDALSQSFLENAVEYVATAALILTSVDPHDVLADGTTALNVHGENFLPETVIHVGANDLASPVLVDATLITGLAPALGSEEALGFRTVVAEDARGRSVLESAVEYVADPEIPGPQQIETSLAEGTARFQWFNPQRYSAVQVFDGNDQLIRTLDGDTRFLELEAPASTEVPIRLVGIIENDRSRFSDAIATLLQCSRPSPLNGNGLIGELEFSLYGGHSPAAIARCAGGGGGGGGEGAEALDTGGGNGGGFLQAIGTKGYLISNFASAFLSINQTNQLTTGFTLSQDADKLEFSGYYLKAATDLGVELRAKLTHVDPEDGFADEFTFPDINVDLPKDWNSITYYRADKDVGSLGDTPPAACKLKIPKGDYLLDVYSVGGSSALPYYVFADDARDNELLSKGSPCPPYPLVRVTDMTGFATLPDVLDITATPTGSLKEAKICSGLSQVMGTFSAVGSWLDEAGVVHSIDPADPTYIPMSGFEFVWTFSDKQPPTTVSSGSSSSVTTCVADYGCFDVDLVIRDKRCGFSKKRTLETILLPRNVTCNPNFLAFLTPTPEPGGIFAVAGLNPGPGNGTFKGKRTLEFKVLVVPPCYCTGGVCPAPKLGEFEMRLAVETGPGSYTPLAATLLIEDNCKNQTKAAKYFHATLDDIGAIPSVPGADYPAFRPVHIQARSTKPGDTFRNVGSPFFVSNRPPSLDHTYWNGNFDDRDASYHFVTKSSRSTQSSFDIPPSKKIDLPGLPVSIESKNNDLSSGFTSRFRMQNGAWSPETGSGTTSGQILSNKMDGAPLQVKPTVVGGGGGVGEGGLAFPEYDWCDHESIFNNHFSQTLFEAILYTGTIGPIPVTVWASIGLGLDFKVDSQLNVRVSPFGPLSGGHYAETHFYLLSSVDIQIPCEIRADILMGIASVAARLIPEANFEMDTHISSIDADPQADLYIGAFLSMYFEVEACLNFIIDSICFSPGRVTLINHQPLIPQQGSPPDVVACPGGGAADNGSAGNSGSGGDIITLSKFVTTSAPTTAISPDGKTTIDAWIEKDGSARVFINGTANALPGGDTDLGVFRDPVAAFISNDQAIIAWSRSFADETGITLPTTIDDRNAMARQEEIVISPVKKIGAGWVVRDSIRIADVPAEVPDLLDRRADGRTAISAELGDVHAIVAWVRYETPDLLIVDGTKTIPVPNGIPQTVPNERPQLEKTAIYVRHVDPLGAIEPARKISPDGNGINLEPTLSVSPSGLYAYAVWVNDSTPGHVDLIDSNRGRQLLYSVYSKAADTWSAPQSVLSNVADYDAFYPGVLEPSISLKADGDGLLAFTALDKSASGRDSGLGGGSRFVYGCRLIGGLFGAPFLIHGKCQTRTYGHWVHTHVTIPDLVDPKSHFHIPQPEWVMTWQGIGEVGTRRGAGDVMVSVLGAGMAAATFPVSITPDANLHSNVSAAYGAGNLRTINLNAGPAGLSARALAGGGAAGDAEFEVIEIQLQPDLAIAGCTLSDAFPAPGTPVTATVLIENRGLAGTATDDSGESVCGVRAVFFDASGNGRVVASAPLPILVPGESREVTLDLAMPHDPVKLRVEVDPDPVDSDLTNNSRDYFFGAPPPADLSCETIVIADGTDRLAARLSWTDPATYDEVLLYRDGSMFATAPGVSTGMVDLYAGPGAHTYSVRGRIGASKSVRAECTLDVAPPSPFRFIRGDSNSDKKVDISDGIFTLQYLFLGGAIPVCLKAVDSDDSGTLDISDAIFVLSYLFTGGKIIPAPFPDCGQDPKEDSLDCETQLGCR